MRRRSRSMRRHRRRRRRAMKIVVGAHAACAVMSDATLRCWGANGDGQLGDGTRHDSATPVDAEGARREGRRARRGFACALIDDTSVVCWGSIGFGKGDRLSRRPPRRACATSCGSSRSVARRVRARRAARSCAGAMSMRAATSRRPAQQHAPTPVPGVDHVVALSRTRRCSKTAMSRCGSMAVRRSRGRVAHVDRAGERDWLRVCASRRRRGDIVMATCRVSQNRATPATKQTAKPPTAQKDRRTRSPVTSRRRRAKSRDALPLPTCYASRVRHRPLRACWAARRASTSNMAARWYAGRRGPCATTCDRGIAAYTRASALRTATQWLGALRRPLEQEPADDVDRGRPNAIADRRASATHGVLAEGAHVLCWEGPPRAATIAHDLKNPLSVIMLETLVLDQ